MKALLTTILIACLAVPSFGQAKSKKASIKWGPTQKINAKDDIKGLIGYGKDHVYLLYRKESLLSKNKYVIKAYNNKLQPTKESEFKYEYNGRPLIYERSMQLDGKVFLFSSYYNNKQKKKYLFVQELDEKRLLPSKDLKKLAAIDFSGKWTAYTADFNIDFSIDSSRILVYYDLPYHKKENEKFGLHVLDREMNNLWSQEVTIPIEDQLVSIEDFTVSNEGNAYILVKKYDEKPKESRKGEVNYNYVLLGYHENSDDNTEATIKVDDIFLRQMAVAVNPREEVICVGFYNDDHKEGMKGPFYLRMDGATGEILSQNYQPFTVDFLTSHLTKKQEEKRKKKLEKGKDVDVPVYKTKAILFRPDGGFYCISENSYENFVTSINTDGRSSSRTYFNDHNIAVIKVGPSGEIEWSERVVKYQRIADAGFYNSFALIPKGDNLHFIYNDDPENLFLKGTGSYSTFYTIRTSQIVMVSMGPDGQKEKGLLNTATQSEVALRPKEVVRISADQALVLGTYRKKIRIGTLNFK